MSDITMCTDQDCPMQDSCRRLNAPPDLHRQSYQDFKFNYDEFENNNNYQCEFYIDMQDIFN
jgi:hypothetical protein